jgi:hypothetical protein
MAGRVDHAFGAVRRREAAGHVIDVETLLVRKIFEDTPNGLGAGLRNRVTTTFEPQANPVLEDSRFRFTVPK